MYRSVMTPTVFLFNSPFLYFCEIDTTKTISYLAGGKKQLSLSSFIFSVKQKKGDNQHAFAYLLTKSHVELL